MINNYWQLGLAASGGLGLGLFFYGGLYFTVTRGLNSKHPALWFFSSFFLRITLVLMGFYFIGDGSWQRILACLLSFVVTGFAFKIWGNRPPAIERMPDKIVSPLHSSTTKNTQHSTYEN